MESTLRPRDIQTRIRAGETPEAVAQAAGSSVERIMPFAAPVLAERAHVAQRAQLSSVRRRTGESGARTLGEAVAAQLRAHNVDPDHVEWDAWRREDGRWTVTGAYSAGGRTGTATYAFDTRGNYVTVEDEDGHWLAGDSQSRPEEGGTPGSATAADDLAAVRQRRLSAVPADELPLGADTIEMLADESADDTAGPTETNLDLDEVRETPDDQQGAGPSSASDADDATPDDGEDVAQQAPEEPAAKRSSRRRGRASVPSWDEIMFGGGKGD